MMRKLTYTALGLALLLPGMMAAAPDVPGSAEWYFHIDLERLRSEDAVEPLYGWLQGEVFDEVREDAGFDIEKELDAITAFSIAGEGPVIVVDGDLSQQSQDRLMALIAAEGDLTPMKSSGRAYYRVGEPGGTVKVDGSDVRVSMESLEDGGYVSTDIDGKLLITGAEDQMQALLANKGRIAGTRGTSSAILVLTAERSILQAGMNSSFIDEGDDDWDSNILRNTEQVAFLVAAAADKLAVQAQLVTNDAEMASSLASVARGLLSLVSFDDAMPPEMAAMLRDTKIETKGADLHISLAVDPKVLVESVD